MLRTLILSTLICISSSAGGWCQSVPQLRFHQLGAADGLPQSHINCIIQDQQGFMWIGTWDGLYRYDGYSFKAFLYDPLNMNSLNSGWIECLLVDVKGLLWIGTANGLHCYDPASGKMKLYVHSEDSNTLCHNVITCLVEDDAGNIWIGTEEGLSVLDVVNQKFRSFHHDETRVHSISSNDIMSFLYDRENRLWIGTVDGLNLFDPESRSFTVFRNNAPGLTSMGIANASPDFIPCMLEDQKGNFWVGTWGYGLQLFNPETHSFRSFLTGREGDISVAGSVVNAICEDQSGNIWVGTYDGGLNHFDVEQERLTPFRAAATQAETLKGDHVMCIYSDRSGMLWVGTNGGGLNVASLAAEKFSVFKNYDEDIQTHFLLHVGEDREGNIWLSSFGGGLKCFNPTTNEVRSYSFDQNDLVLASCNWAQCSMEDRDGNFWFGVFGGLAMLNKQSGAVDYYRCFLKPNETVIVHGMAEGNGDTIWLATSSGFKFFLEASRTFNQVDQPADVLKQDIPFLYKDRSGKIWIAGSSLHSYDPSAKLFRRYDPGLAPDGAAEMMITGIFEGRDGKIWAGSASNGLLCLDPVTGKMSRYTTASGLASNAVAGIVEDDDGQLWVSTSKGVSLWNSSQSDSAIQFRNYDISDGIAGNDNQFTTILKSRSGTIYVGTSAGLYYFNPAQLSDNGWIPPVVITGFHLMNKEITAGDSGNVFSQPVEFTTQINISYRQNVIAFTFAALNFLHPEKNQYAYRLEGFDRDWIYTDASKRFANYTNLDAGEYTFKVKGSNNDGVWNETPATIKLTILPPYWQTWWFKLLCILAAGGIIYAVIYSRMQKMRDLRRIRNKIASDLHDDLGATLSSISIMSEIANHQIRNQSPQTSPLLEKIGSSSRNMIEHVNDMVWAINPKNDSFENIIRRMRAFASEILEAKDINFNFDFDKTILQSKLKMDTRRNFYLIFKEAINNIAKYSGAANAFITILQRERNLKMTIRDDGKGFDPSLIQRGNGLNNMEQRAEEMKAKFILQTDIGKGTMVQLEFKNG